MLKGILPSPNSSARRLCRYALSTRSSITGGGDEIRSPQISAGERAVFFTLNHVADPEVSVEITRGDDEETLESTSDGSDQAVFSGFVQSAAQVFTFLIRPEEDG